MPGTRRSAAGGKTYRLSRVAVTATGAGSRDRSSGRPTASASRVTGGYACWMPAQMLSLRRPELRRGDDSGYVYSAICREPRRNSSYIARREAALKVQAAKTRLEEIKRDIQQRGEKPEPAW